MVHEGEELSSGGGTEGKMGGYRGGASANINI